MASQHYRCPNCGTVDLITYTLEQLTAARAAGRWPPICSTPECYDVQMELYPQQMITDLKTDGGTGQGFQKFNVHRQVMTRDGLQQVEETVDSLHKLRQIEQDSEQRYRNGEGEPLRFRAAAQNASNMDQNAFGHSGTIGERHYDDGQAPRKKMPVTKHGTKKPKVAVAKGGGVSALKR